MLSRALRRRAEAELENQVRYESFRAALLRRQYEAAMALFGEIPETSVYKDKARVQAEAVRTEYINAKLTEARAARRLKLCPEVRRLAQAILALDKDQAEAQSLEEQCMEEQRRPKRPSPERRPREEPPGPSLKDLRDPFAH